MHLVSNDRSTVRTEDLPANYPLGISGLGRLRPQVDNSFGAQSAPLTKASVSKAAAQQAHLQREAKRDAANAARAAQAQAVKAKRDSARANHAAAVSAHRDQVAQQHAAAHQQHAAAAQAHAQAAAAAKQARQDKAAAHHAAAAQAHANKAGAHGKAAKANANASNSADIAQLRSMLESSKASQASKLNALKSKLAQLQAKKAGKRLRGLMGLMGLRGMGDFVLDPNTNQMIDSVTGQPADPSALGNTTTAPVIDPTTGQPIPTSGGDPMMAMILQLFQTSQGTPPKNCKPGSSKPVCVFYYADQQNKKILGILLQEILQMNQQIDSVNQQILALIDQINGTQTTDGGIPNQNTQQPVFGPGYQLDANGQPIGPAFDPYGNPNPAASLPLPTEYDPYAQGMPQLPYGPGGGMPQLNDPNLPPEYAGMPSMTDPYGDVATIPDGYGGGNDGSGGDNFIPDSVPVSAGPVGYDFQADVQAFPEGAMDSSGGYAGGSDYIPMGVDAYVGPSDVQQLQPMIPQMQRVPSARQALPAPQSVIASDATPQPMIAAAANEQEPNPLATEDQGQILSESFDNSEA